MKKNVLSLWMAGVLLFFYTTSLAQTWTGAANSNWFNAANWNPAAVPAATDAVTIPGALSTYPVLTANVTVGQLTMNTGSALHLAGFTFTNNGSIFIEGATVDGGGALNTINAPAVTIQNNSIMASLAVTNYSGYAYFFNNTVTGNVALSDSSIQNSSVNYVDGNLITGDLSITHRSTMEMDEGYGANQGDHITGNVTVTISGTGAFYTSYSHGLQVDGNLTVNRTMAGTTYMFNNPSAIGGNLSYTATGGVHTFGTINGISTIGGTINLNSTAASSITLYRIKNGTTGGTITATDPVNIDLRNDTLNAVVSITNYHGAFTVYSNSFTGNVTFGSASDQNTSTNYWDGNLFTGNLSATHNGSLEMDEGYGSDRANHITGNATFTIGGTGPFYTSYSHGLQVDGNLTINRTAGGTTGLFRNPSTVLGNLSLTLNGGNTFISNANNSSTTVGGTLNINATNQNEFKMYKLSNSVSGGNVTIPAPGNVDLRNDTLQASLSITDYTGSFTVFNNSFIGNVNLSDATNQGTNINYWDGNLFTGNLNVAHNSSLEMDEGYGSDRANHVTGNATFTIGGTGSFYTSYSHGLQVDGSTTVNRTAAGFTHLFRNGGTVLGGFSFNTIGGDNRISDNSNAITNINGIININANNVSRFELFKVKNGTAGGTIQLTNPGNVSMQNDTVLATLNIIGYSGSLTVFNNSVTGNSFFSDIAAQNTNTAYIDGNLFAGNRTLVHNSPFEFYDGYGSSFSNSNVTTGTDSIANNGGNFYVGYSHPTQVRGNFIVNTAASSNTFLYGVTFAGTSDSHIRQAGAKQVVFNNLFMNKTAPGRLYPDTNISISQSLQFNSGIVVTAANKNLIFANNATVSGASDNAHVAGPVVKAGNEPFTFPVGNGTTLATVGISAPATSTDTIRATFFYANPAAAGYDTSAAHRDASLKKISGCEYWDLTHISGTSAVAVTLQYGPPCNAVNSMAALRVAHYNGTTWKDLGNGGVTGTSTAGSIKSATAVASFSPFTLASIEDNLYILPITLTQFTARRLNATALLDWITATEKNSRGFYIQRSSDGSNWTSIGYVAAGGNTAITRTYRFTDAQPVKGANYYRLQIVDVDGKQTYSAVRTVLMGEGGNGSIAIYPNPVSHTLYFSGDVKTISIRNTLGKIIYTGQGTGSFDMRSLPAGLYLLQVTKLNGASETVKVVKE